MAELDIEALEDAPTRSITWSHQKDAIVAALKSCEEARKAFGKLCRFTPESVPPGFKGDYYEDGDERAPFMTEAYLYNLLGKEDARTLLAYAGRLARALNTDLHRVMVEL